MRLRALAVAALAAGSIACASAPRFTSSEEQQAIEARLTALEKQSAQAQLEIERLKHRLAELAAPVARSASPGVPPADTPSVPEALAAPPRAGRVEESDLGEPAASPVPSPETTAYEDALKLLRAGSLAEAETKLRRFTDERPDSDLADNAWFWIGESRLARGDNLGALDAYRTTIDRYPEGNKVPDALLKLGQALLLTGDRASAREAWTELVNRFPTTAAAESARARLAEP
jgi:tol-pal system protein YbgF